MAAPTVGSVLGDILPYLGVEPTFTAEDAAGSVVVLEDYTGLTLEDAQKQLKALGLTFRIQGKGETVTAQIPAVGQSIPGNSQVILYCGETPETQTVAVPDFKGMNRQQASDTAGSLGLYILVAGNQEISPAVTVTAQSEQKDTQVPVGTTIRLEFADTKVQD